MDTTSRKFFSLFLLLILALSVGAAGCTENPFEDDDDDDDEGAGGGDEKKDESPKAEFEPSKDMAEIGTNITFDASDSEAKEGNITLYQWDFGDNTYEEGNDSSVVSHQYLAPGTFNVSLTIKDENNLTNTTWYFIGIYDNLQDSGQVSDLSGTDTQNHQHQIGNDAIWVFYHIELENPFSDPRTASCTMELTIGGASYWQQSQEVTNQDMVIVEFNVTVHMDDGTGGNDSWTHNTGTYDFTITVDEGTVDWDLAVKVGYRNGKPEDQPAFYDE